MRDYVEQIINDLTIKLYENDTAKTPANDNLFKIFNIKMSLKDKSEIFNTITEKVMFLWKGARLDIQPTIVILCSRSKNPNEGYTNKLTGPTKYLNRTREMILTLSSDNTRIIKWYVNATFAVHTYFKSHTGMKMKMRQGEVISISKKKDWIQEAAQNQS